MSGQAVDKTMNEVGVAPHIDLDRQNETVNDILGIAVICFAVLVMGLFLFRRLSPVGRGGGCAGCSSGSCPTGGPDEDLACHSSFPGARDK